MPETTVLQLCNPKNFKESVLNVDKKSNPFLLCFIKEFVLTPNQKFTNDMKNNKLLTIYCTNKEHKSSWLDSFVIKVSNSYCTYFKVNSFHFIYLLSKMNTTNLEIQFNKDFLVLQSGKQEKVMNLEKASILR